MKTYLVQVNYYNGKEYEDAYSADEILGLFSTFEKATEVIKDFYFNKKYHIRHGRKYRKIMKSKERQLLSSLVQRKDRVGIYYHFEITTESWYWGETEWAKEYYTISIIPMEIDKREKVEI